MARLDTLRSQRAVLLRIAERHGASDVRVFGSVARGEDGAGSDVDFLVKIADGRSLFDLVRLHDDFEQLLGQPVDIVTEGGVNPHLRARIFDEAIPL